MERSTALVSGTVEGSRSLARWRCVRGLAAVAVAAALAGCTPSGADDPANELPFGAVDLPTQGAQVKALSPVAGWALDDRGIREIRLFIDGHLANTTHLTQARPDVSQIYPQYARGRQRHGFTMLAGFDVPGPHTIVVQAVDTDGATRDIGVVTVTAVDKE